MKKLVLGWKQFWVINQCWLNKASSAATYVLRGQPNLKQKDRSHGLWRGWTFHISLFEKCPNWSLGKIEVLVLVLVASSLPAVKKRHWRVNLWIFAKPFFDFQHDCPDNEDPHIFGGYLIGQCLIKWLYCSCLTYHLSTALALSVSWFSKSPYFLGAYDLPM